jgi:hypothetical protein
MIFLIYMEVIEYTLDSAMARGAGSSSASYLDWPLFDMGNRGKYVHGIKVIEATIPKTWDNWVTSVENGDGDGGTIIFQDGASNEYSVVIDAGRYTKATFITTVNLKLSEAAFIAFLVLRFGAGTPVVTLNYDETLQKFFIDFDDTGGAGNFDPMRVFMFYEDQPSNFFLGLNDTFKTYSENVIAGTPDHNITYMPKRAYAEISPSYLQINSDELGSTVKVYNPMAPDPVTGTNGLNAVIGGNGEASSAIATITTTSNESKTLIWQDPQPSKVFTMFNEQFITKLDLYLTLGPFNGFLSLNGAPWMCKIALLVSDTPQNV